MQIILIYDITNDRARGKVADACMDYGLDRIQYSAFSGALNRNHQEELLYRIENLIQKVGGKVWLMPVADKEWDKRFTLEIENARQESESSESDGFEAV